MHTLSKYEQELSDYLNEIPLKSIKNEQEFLENLKEGLKKKTKSSRINIRLYDNDLLLIKKKAEKEGLPYQTYLSSQIHKLAEGRLKEIDKD